MYGMRKLKVYPDTSVVSEPYNNRINHTCHKGVKTIELSKTLHFNSNCCFGYHILKPYQTVRFRRENVRQFYCSIFSLLVCLIHNSSAV